MEAAKRHARGYAIAIEDSALSGREKAPFSR